MDKVQSSTILLSHLHGQPWPRKCGSYHSTVVWSGSSCHLNSLIFLSDFHANWSWTSTLSVCVFLNKFSHRWHHYSKLHFGVSLLLSHAAHTKWDILSGMASLSLYILMFCLNLHSPVALHNHVCICYWFTVSPSVTSELPRLYHPHDLGRGATDARFPIWSLLPDFFMSKHTPKSLRKKPWRKGTIHTKIYICI